MKKKISDSFLPAPLLSCAEGPTAAFPTVLERDPGAGRCGHGSARWRARTRVDTRGHAWTCSEATARSFPQAASFGCSHETVFCSSWLVRVV